MSTPTQRADATTSVIVAGARMLMGRLLGSLSPPYGWGPGRGWR